METQHTTAVSPGSAFYSGALDTLPLIIGAIPFGIVFGTLGLHSGLSAWATMSMSLLVFAGSAQFIAVGLLAAGTSVWLIIFTTFVVNLRHLLYSVALLPQVSHLSGKWRLPLAFGLTDESFAVVTGHRSQRWQGEFHWYFLGSSVAMYTNWQLCTLIGITLGELFPGIENWGLDVAMVVTFIGIVVPQIINRPRLVAALVSIVLALVLNHLPHKIGLFVAAIGGVAAGVLSSRWFDLRRNNAMRHQQ